jgi:hypothetical protein
MRRPCQAAGTDGRPCRAAPLVDGVLCFFHAPETAPEAAEARRVGGLRRRREKTVEVLYGLDGLDGVTRLGRVLDLVIHETLSLDNGLGRNRTLLLAVRAWMEFLRITDHEARLAALETLLLRIDAARADPTGLLRDPEEKQ